MPGRAPVCVAGCQVFHHDLWRTGRATAEALCKECVEILAVVGEPREIVGTECHLRGEGRTRLVEFTDLGEQLRFRPGLTAVIRRRVVDGIDVISVEDLPPHGHDDTVQRRHRNAGNEVLALSQLGRLVAPGNAPVIRCLDEQLDALAAREHGIGRIQCAGRIRARDRPERLILHLGGQGHGLLRHGFVEHSEKVGLVDEATFGALIDNQRMETGLVVVEVVLVVFEPVLHGNDAAVLVAKTADESVDRHAGQRDDARVGRELRADGGVVIRVARHDAARPRVGGVAAFSLANPRVLVTQQIHCAVIVEKADDAIAVARAHRAGGFILLFKALVANVAGITRRADNIQVRLGIAGIGLCLRGSDGQNEENTRARDGALSAA